MGDDDYTFLWSIWTGIYIMVGGYTTVVMWLWYIFLKYLWPHWLSRFQYQAWFPTHCVDPNCIREQLDNLKLCHNCILGFLSLVAPCWASQETLDNWSLQIVHSFLAIIFTLAWGLCLQRSHSMLDSNLLPTSMLFIHSYAQASQFWTWVLSCQTQTEMWTSWHLSHIIPEIPRRAWHNCHCVNQGSVPDLTQ